MNSEIFFILVCSVIIFMLIAFGGFICGRTRWNKSSSGDEESASIEGINVTIYYHRREDLYLYGDEVLRSRLEELCSELSDAKKDGANDSYLLSIVKYSSLVINLENEFDDSVSDVYPFSSLKNQEVFFGREDTIWIHSGNVFSVSLRI